MAKRKDCSKCPLGTIAKGAEALGLIVIRKVDDGLYCKKPIGTGVWDVRTFVPAEIAEMLRVKMIDKEEFWKFYVDELRKVKYKLGLSPSYLYRNDTMEVWLAFCATPTQKIEATLKAFKEITPDE